MATRKESPWILTYFREMKTFALHRVMCLMLLFFAQCKEEKKQEMAPETPSNDYPVLEAGKLEARSESFWELLPRDGKLEILASGHEWTEGPLWIASDSLLLYTDIPRNAVYGWREGEEAFVYLQPSGFLGENFEGKEPGANGLILDAEGNLVLCQHGERRMARMTAPVGNPKPEFEVLADRYEGKRFNSPNDAVYHSGGALYFTDPPYGLPNQMEDAGKELEFQGVYRLDPDGIVRLLTREFTRPNGIAFSPDEKQLYVANSDPEQAIWKVFEVSADGTLSKGRILFDATDRVSQEAGLPDGMAVHTSGAIFATGPGGVFVFRPDGELLGRILTGQATANCTFNTDQSVLYITADSYLLRLKMR